MLLSKTVEVKWNSKNKKKYESLGYTFTGMGTTFMANVSDLNPYSRSKVTVSCDYCGKIFTKTYRWYYKDHNNQSDKKDCCSSISCTNQKIKDTFTSKYGDGVTNAAHIKEVSEKKRITSLNRYGVENPASLQSSKDKAVDTYISKYGVDHPMKLKQIQDKVVSTCLEKYGVPCYLNIDYGRGVKREKSPTWNPDITDEQRESKRCLPEYRQWRMSVFERDEYTCKCCGGKGVRLGSKCKSNYLNAHHIFNFKDWVELRYDVDNGVTLCNLCHHKFHQIYGNRDNTDKQLKEFLNMMKRYAELAENEPQETSDKKPA